MTRRGKKLALFRLKRIVSEWEGGWIFTAFYKPDQADR